MSSLQSRISSCPIAWAGTNRGPFPSRIQRGLDRPRREPSMQPPLAWFGMQLADDPATRSPLALSVEGLDRYRWLLPAAGVGVAIAFVLGLIGLPPVEFHSPLHYLGIMDPLCGGTRALRDMALGHWGTAWTYNPLSVVLFLGAWAALLRAVVGRLTGRWIAVAMVRIPLSRWLGTGLLVALEINQQLHARLLMH